LAVAVKFQKKKKKTRRREVKEEEEEEDMEGSKGRLRWLNKGPLPYSLLYFDFLI
jgi:hypothetical protein